MTGLGTFSATAMIEVTAVNRGGAVVAGSGGHTLLVHNGTINDDGQIVASSPNAQGHEHAFPAHTQLVTAPRTYHPLA
jgi:hypothetical protein